MDNTIIGRKEEIQILQSALDSTDPQFLAIYGRRRIGKTFLITEFFKDKGLYFEITGMKGGTTKEQLFQFTHEYTRTFQINKPLSKPESWAEALTMLYDAIENVSEEQKIILFFDELPWLASPRSRFIAALEHCWNRYISRRKNVILIICGSSASWIIRNIINNKGGLHGRITRKIRLLPFSLAETEKYLISRHIHLDRKQIVDIYIAIGGVPKYLSYVTKGKSSTQTINDICFSPQGALRDEFHNLYRSLFSSFESHISIVKILSKASSGMNKDQLLKKAKLTSGGSSSKIIEELVDAGFIAYIPSFGTKKSKGLYRLIDEYSLFYLSWIADMEKSSLAYKDPDYWIKMQQSPSWHSWSGYAFEALALKHISHIKKGLGISGVSSTESAWKHLAKKQSKDKGTQIDLVIDRSDQCINLCEIKYCRDKFTVDKEYGRSLEDKKQIFRKITKTTKSLFLTMITTYGTHINTHYQSVVDNQITMDDLFS